MNWQVFGTIGYLGIALGVAAVVVWLVHWKVKHRWLPYLGILLAVAAAVCARLNSSQHVSRIELDPSIMLAEIEARQKAKEQALIDSRSGEVAQIQFAEDAQGEQLDTAGMDEVDLKYMKAIMEDDTPAWKKQKRSRGDNAAEDDSLESKIGATSRSEGADVSALEADSGPEPILLDEASMVLADHLDFWNLRVTLWLVVVALLVVLVDYLRRANLYHEALWPLPLPSSWLNALTPQPVVMTRPDPARRDIAGELAWFTRRGDRWIYFTDRPQQTGDILSRLKRYRRWPWRLDLIRVDERMDDAFVFESAWYGRASFIADSLERNLQLLGYCLSQLKHRRITRARVGQTVHLVWDCDQELTEEAFEAFRQRAAVSGVSLFVIPQTRSES